VLRNLAINPKIVGGITPAAAERAEAFYHTYLGAPVINVGSLEAAEMAKLAGMIYRDVNIALANELARYAETLDIDLTALIKAINTDGEAALLNPGIGVGGHCTPVYPYFLIQDARRVGSPVTLAERSRRINEQQPFHVLDRLEEEWGLVAGLGVRILGLGFRPQVKEHINSPAFALRDELQRRGALVSLHDPFYSPDEVRAHGFVPAAIDGRPVPQVLVLNTAHKVYLGLDFESLAHLGVQAVVDGRNVWDVAQVTAAGLSYVGVGRPYRRTTPASAQRLSSLAAADRNRR
jgi:nucleotide sugar dehydrogenase